MFTTLLKVLGLGPSPGLSVLGQGAGPRPKELKGPGPGTRPQGPNGLKRQGQGPKGPPNRNRPNNGPRGPWAPEGGLLGPVWGRLPSFFPLWALGIGFGVEINPQLNVCPVQFNRLP